MIAKTEGDHRSSYRHCSDTECTNSSKRISNLRCQLKSIVRVRVADRQIKLEVVQFGKTNWNSTGVDGWFGYKKTKASYRITVSETEVLISD